MAAINEYHVSYGAYYAHLNLETRVVRIYNHSGPEFLCGTTWANYSIVSPGPELSERDRLGLSRALIEAMYA